MILLNKCVEPIEDWLGNEIAAAITSNQVPIKITCVRILINYLKNV